VLRRAALSGLLTAVACGSTVERGYYAPLDADFGKSLARAIQSVDGVRYEVACQGVYLNTVAGVERRTAHLQLQILRTEPGDVVLPIEDLRVDFLYEGAAGQLEGEPVGLRATEVWSGRKRVVQSLLVPAWTRRYFDLFFDHPDAELPVPDVVRFRWRSRTGNAWSVGDCMFQRIAEDDPRLPEELPSADRAFGLRDGYYMPGFGRLGPRELIDTVEERPYYVFHDPGDSWIF